VWGRLRLLLVKRQGWGFTLCTPTRRDPCQWLWEDQLFVCLFACLFAKQPHCHTHRYPLKAVENTYKWCTVIKWPGRASGPWALPQWIWSRTYTHRGNKKQHIKTHKKKHGTRTHKTHRNLWLQSMLVAEKTGELKRLENLVQNQSFGNLSIVRAPPTATPCNGGTDNVAGTMTTWWTCLPIILQIHSLH